ncbi:hypothetical protein HD553DRAFT_350052 [Filobasidium floriforme]|uniref:uncharacterized protein n=1 Tax=Filobasidium floriforme TaxID=5210 RepID=UPI001E8CF4AC|nr:uncharacterized protein HD553DRAFT_350052 [Filobasidium floriforme]KAH8084630.1 hypothetical protein HD553DRAFT_350052 [Filobasidium floriforme]
MGQKFSAWKQSHKEKKAAKEREEAAKRKNAPHQHGDYTIGDPTVPDVPNPAPAPPAPAPAPVAGAATAVSIGMLRDLAPDPNSRPENHEAQILASQRENVAPGSTTTGAGTGAAGGGYPYAGTAAGGYGLMGGDFGGDPDRDGVDDDAGTGGVGGMGSGGMSGGGGMGGSTGGGGGGGPTA